MDVSRSRTLLLIVVALASGLVAAVAAPRITRVTVLKTDGKPVTGELMESSPAGVTVRPGPKADPVALAWADIKAVSGGMTRQKALDDWKVSHADRLCPDCAGEGAVPCETCHGTGVDPAQAKPCVHCKGTGSIGKCSKCTDGEVPCPAPCIKASDYTGKIGPDGTKQGRTFHNMDGSTFYFHDHHIGELPVEVDGKWVSTDKCPTCAGTSKVTCPTCHGTAKIKCMTCRGAGVVGPACGAGCKTGRVQCKTCGGTGLRLPSDGKPAVAQPSQPAVPTPKPKRQ